MKENTNTKPFYNSKIPDDWEMTELGEIGAFSKGRGILKDQVVERGLPCIRYGEIYTSHDFIIKEFKSFISDVVAKESQEIKNGDILFAGSGETAEEIGKAVAFIGDEKAYAGGDVIILSTISEVNAEYLSYALESNFAQKQKRVLGQGHSIVHIYPSDLSKLKLPLPPLPEQIRIAEVLSTWDEAITKTNQLIARKELRKKWLMQQLLTGKKRLKGFFDNLRKTKLAEIGSFFKGSGITKNDLLKEGIPCIRYGEIYTTHNTVINEFTSFISAKTAQISKRIQYGDILFAGSGETAEEIGKCVASLKKEESYAGGDIIILRPNSNTDSLFFSYMLNSENINNQKYSMGKGHSVVHIYPKDLAEIVLYVPSIEEQTAIAQVLQTADKEIQLLRYKAEKLKEQKKGLMQMLLTGKKRLKIM